jgi:hypothetical protein
MRISFVGSSPVPPHTCAGLTAVVRVTGSLDGALAGQQHGRAIPLSDIWVRTSAAGDAEVKRFNDRRQGWRDSGVP